MPNSLSWTQQTTLSYWRTLLPKEGWDILTLPSGIALRSPAPLRSANSVWATDLEAFLKPAQDFLNGHPAFWHVTEAQTPSLCSRLQATFCEPMLDLSAPVHTLELHHLHASPHISIREVRTLEDLGHYAHILEVVFKRNCTHTLQMAKDLLGKPHTTLYLASYGTQPAASMHLYVDPTTGLGGIYSVAVLPEYQGKRLGRTLVEYALRVAKARSATRVSLYCHPKRASWYAYWGFRTERTFVAVA